MAPQQETQADLDALWDAGEPLSPAEMQAPATPGPPRPPGPAGPPSIDIFTPVPGTGQRTGNVATEHPAPSGFGRAIRGGLSLIPPALEVGGSIVGQRLGVGPISRLVTSGLGTMAGRTAATPVSGPPSIEDLAWSGAAGMAGEAAMVPVAAGVSKLAAPFKSRLVPGAQEAITALDAHVTPAQVSDSQTLNVIENVMSGSLFGGGRYRRFLADQEALLGKRAEEILSQFGPKVTREEAGRVYREGLEAAHRTAKESASTLYDDVDQLAEGVTVPLQPLRDFVTEETARRGALGRSLTGGKAESTLGKVERATTPPETDLPAGAEYGLAALGGMEDLDAPAAVALRGVLSDAGVGLKEIEAGQVTFRQAHEIRSALGRLMRDAQHRGDPQLKGVSTQLFQRIDEAMKGAAGKDTPLAQAYATASKAWKTMADTYEKGLLKDVAKKRPDVVVKEIIKPGRVEEIDRARQVVGADTWKQVQRAHAEDLLAAKDGDLVTGEQLMSKLQSLKPETVAAVYPRGIDQSLWQLARVMRTVQRRQGGNLKMWIQLAQGGAIGGVVTGKVAPRTAAIVLTPLMMTRAVLHPQARQWLTTGLSAGATGRIETAARATTQLTAWLIKEGLVDPAQSAMTPGPAQPTLAAPPASGRGAGPGPRGGAVPAPPLPPELSPAEAAR